MREQEFALKRGVDIIVGTPGRIKVISFSYLDAGIMSLEMY